MAWNEVRKTLYRREEGGGGGGRGKEEGEKEEEKLEKEEGAGGGRGEERRGDDCDEMSETIPAAVCPHLHEGIHLLPHSVSKSPLYHQASREGRRRTGKEVILHGHTCTQAHLLNVFLLVSFSDRDVPSPWLQVDFNHLHHIKHDQSTVGLAQQSNSLTWP